MVSVDVKHHVYLLGHKTQTKIHVFRFGQRVCVEKHALQAETLCFALDGGSIYQRAHYCKLKTLYSLLGEGHYCKLKTLYSLLGEGLCWSVTQAENPVFCIGWRVCKGY